MKQVKLKMPLGLSEAFATFLFENAMMPLITYATDEFFNSQLVAIIAIKEGEQLETFTKSEYAKYISK